MHGLSLAYALVGGLAVAIAVGSAKLRQLPVSEPLLALIVGVLAGPAVLGLLDVPQELRSTLLLEVSRALLAISLMAIALRYPVRDLQSLGKPLLILILVVLPVMAAVTAGLALITVGLTVGLALLLGACLSPTDPVLASSVVTGGPAEESLPARTRRLLSMESGINDGLAYPFVVVALAVAVPASLAGAAGKAAYGVVAAVALGALLGWVAAKALNFADERGDVDAGSMLVFTIVLAIAVLGAARLIRADGVLAVFVAGLLFNALAAPGEREQEGKIDEALNRYLVLPLFLLLGLELPWGEWRHFGWGAAAFVVLVLLLRRLPWLLALKRPLELRRRDAVFLGWFGPIGVSAVFYLSHAEEKGATDPRLWALGSLVVVASTVVHGITSSPGRQLYERVAAGSRPAAAEAPS